MEDRQAKLALARKKLRDHQEKKLYISPKDNSEFKIEPNENTIYATNNSDSSHILNIQAATLVMASPAPSTPGEFEERNDSETLENTIEKIKLPEVSITDMLISNKRELDQIDSLKNKLHELEASHAIITNSYKVCNQKVVHLENELKNVSIQYEIVSKEVLLKESELRDVNSSKSLLQEENTNLLEQLEFTKSVLSAKEAENDSLHNQLYNLQNQYDVVQLKLQQLTNGSINQLANNNGDSERNYALLEKITSLEQQLTLLQKERDQINLHYQHYVAELNEQLKSLANRNEELATEVQCLSNRENSLIEQISDMEIRIQNFNLIKKENEIPQSNNVNNVELLNDFKKIQDELNQLQNKHKDLEKLYLESTTKIMELEVLKESQCQHENISLTKLNADITSDKIAAQRATEQNKKLKQDLQGLEDAFVKMSKDKLELTEKLAAEKYLNRELTIKLAEIDEKAKDMHNKLKAKDVEMLRLLSNYRSIENKCEELKHLERDENNHQQDTVVTDENNDDSEHGNGTCEHENLTATDTEHKHAATEYKHAATSNLNKTESLSLCLPKGDAMVKLQERFLKIMGEVADLSDEKHRLEHIILQLQNETDTICEYVALYQQQRSLLKKRDEERSAQLKIFQEECSRLKSQLEELSVILKRFADDSELSPYFLNESRGKDIQKVMTLLSDLKNNSLIDPKKKNAEFRDFYPCNCCSGKLIDV